MKKNILMFVVFFGVSTILASCTTNNSTVNQSNKSSTQSPPTTEPATASNSVEIKNSSFTPSTITIQKGESVTWVQNDSVSHTVTGDTFDSGTLSKGAVFTQQFNDVGTFTYTCTIHPTMRGSVVVTE